MPPRPGWKTAFPTAPTINLALSLMNNKKPFTSKVQKPCKSLATFSHGHDQDRWTTTKSATKYCNHASGARNFHPMQIKHKMLIVLSFWFQPTNQRRQRGRTKNQPGFVIKQIISKPHSTLAVRGFTWTWRRRVWSQKTSLFFHFYYYFLTRN